MGVLLNDKMDLFKGVKDVNRKGERKEWCLNVEKMTRLYEFFDKGETTDQEGNELYDPQYKKRLFHSLGLFLFSYLANGANMADIVKLRYDDFYYNHEQKAMRFIRQKTMRETDGMEVIFPILPQMQVILDRIARKPQRGALVFDIIKEGMTETRIKEIVSCENANINARMENVAKMLGMEERPTPTWCRHSYATNPRAAGISTEYISTMMGHTITSGSATTLNYLSRYSMDMMVANNSKLLSRSKQDQSKEALLNRLMEMDRERQEIMTKLMEIK
jgi:integrase